MTRIFISHSHSDEAIAYKLVIFLLTALKLHQDDILCTSNPDQGLSFSSSSITDQLKEQLKNSEALIILITADSLHSAWIPFEAGSFWTTDKPIIPILGPGLSQNDLPGPLRSFLGISIEKNDSENKLNNAINQISKKLNIEQNFGTIRNNTLADFSRELKAWESSFPQPDTSQQEQIESLNNQLKELDESYKKQLRETQVISQQQKEELKQNYQQQRQELEQSLKSRIQQLEQQLEQERSQASEKQSRLESSIKIAQEKLTEKEAIICRLKEEIKQMQSPAKNVVTGEVKLKSEKGIDYTNLRDLLAASKWKEADRETTKVMCQATGREKEGWLDRASINNFPCEDLRTINQLWLHYSKGKFGFSVQKEIYESLGGTREYNEEVWEKFGDRVGWREGGKWMTYDELTFILELAPQAHLPVCGVEKLTYVRVLGRVVEGEGRGLRGASSFAQRLVSCNI